MTRVPRFGNGSFNSVVEPDAFSVEGLVAFDLIGILVGLGLLNLADAVIWLFDI